jgi:GT2 family glycosyltransferase
MIREERPALHNIAMDHVVYVVILNWNLKDDTIACVRSVLTGGDTALRIVIVDNGSDDGSVAAFQHLGPRVEVIANKENVGFARGANLGIRHALTRGADYILLLNNDTIAGASLIGSLVEAAASLAEPTVLAPAIFYHDDPRRFWRLGAVHRWGLPVPWEIGRDARDVGQFRQPFEVDYITGCAMWVPAVIFERVGLFDEGFYMYYEDSDFCQRVRRSGFRILVVPQAHIWHKVSRSARQTPGIAAYQHTRNRVIFYNRYATGLGRFSANLYILATTAARMIRSGPDRTMAAHLWRGLLDGWRARDPDPGADRKRTKSGAES